jgi:hypothetical protein
MRMNRPPPPKKFRPAAYAAGKVKRSENNVVWRYAPNNGGKRNNNGQSPFLWSEGETSPLKIDFDVPDGRNADMVKTCATLREYGIFTDIIRENRKTMSLKEAILKAVEVCINKNVSRNT